MFIRVERAERYFFPAPPFFEKSMNSGLDNLRSAVPFRGQYFVFLCFCFWRAKGVIGWGLSATGRSGLNIGAGRFACVLCDGVLGRVGLFGRDGLVILESPSAMLFLLPQANPGVKRI